MLSGIDCWLGLEPLRRALNRGSGATEAAADDEDRSDIDTADLWLRWTDEVTSARAMKVLCTENTWPASKDGGHGDFRGTRPPKIAGDAHLLPLQQA